MRLRLVSTILLGIAITGISSGQSSVRFTVAPIALPPTTGFDDRLWVSDVIGTGADDFLLFRDGSYSGFYSGFPSQFGITDVDVASTPQYVSTTVPSNESVEFVETGDVNSDGLVDAFVGISMGSAGWKIEQRMNVGYWPVVGLPLQTTTTFGPFPVRTRPRLADLDGDGDLDLVMGSSYVLNSGNGTFGAPVTLNFSNPSDLQDVVPGDVDGDGDIDFVGFYTGWGSSSLGGTYGFLARILRRNASGTLTAMLTQLLGDSVNSSHYTRVVAGDVDGDGCMDLVAEEILPMPFSSFSISTVRISTWKGGPGVYFTQQTPFTIYGAERGEEEAKLVDVNGDGILDYVVGMGTIVPVGWSISSSTTALVVLLGTTTGEFVEPTGRGLTEAISLNLGSGHSISTATGTLGSLPDFAAATFAVPGSSLPYASMAVRIINDSIGATPVAAMIRESIGPDILTSGPDPEIRLRLVDSADGAVLRGHLISVTAVATSGLSFSGKYLVASEAVIRLPLGFAAQSFPITVSTVDGYSQNFTVHPAGSLINITGANQAADIFTPFAQPIGATLVNSSGMPMVGVRVDLALPSIGLSSPTKFAYTDSQGRVAFPITATGSFGNYSAILSTGVGCAQTTVPLVVPTNTIVIDSGTGQTACGGTAFPQPIIGHLANQFGTPVAGATVEIIFDSPSVAFVANTTTTGIDGSFSFQALAIGSGSAILTVRRVGTGFVSAPFPMTVANSLVTIASGNSQIAYFGETFAEPLVVSVVDPCTGPVAGTTVAFSTSSSGLTFSAPTAVTDAMGRAAITATTMSEGSMSVTATVGTWQATFQLFTRRLRVTPSLFFLSFSYRHEHPSVPLILAVEPPGAPAIPTPYGTIATSILAPSPTLAVLDGLGLTGPVDGLMVTGAGGTFLRNFAIPPGVSGTFLAQMYGYDLNAAFPFDYIVSNPVTFTF